MSADRDKQGDSHRSSRKLAGSGQPADAGLDVEGDANRHGATMPHRSAAAVQNRLAVTWMLALVSLVWSGGAALTCGYEDPNSANVQRGLMNIVYPKALYVLGAVSLARTNSTLISEPVSLPRRDLFGGAFRRAAEDLRRFGESLAVPESGDMELSVVLLEPMLWTKYTVTAGRASMEAHAKGPLPGKPVLVTSDVVLRYVVAGRLSWKRAEEMGLVRFYGSDSEIQRVRSRLVMMWGPVQHSGDEDADRSPVGQ